MQWRKVAKYGGLRKGETAERGGMCREEVAKLNGDLKGGQMLQKGGGGVVKGEIWREMS